MCRRATATGFAPFGDSRIRCRHCGFTSVRGAFVLIGGAS